jgi:hypothetical protein
MGEAPENAFGVLAFGCATSACTGTEIVFLVQLVQAELAIGVIAPAFDAMVIQDGAGVSSTHANLLGGLAGPELDARKAITHFIRYIAAIIRVSRPS